MLLLQVHYNYLCLTANRYRSLRKYHIRRQGQYTGRKDLEFFVAIRFIACKHRERGYINDNHFKLG